MGGSLWRGGEVGRSGSGFSFLDGYLRNAVLCHWGEQVDKLIASQMGFFIEFLLCCIER